MIRNEVAHLLGERTALVAMIAQTPEDEAIDRASLQSRLEQVEAAIQSAGGQIASPASARLTFRGRPVLGSHGVFAEFGAKAVNDFAETVATLVAGRSRKLAEMGPIPNREESQLLITGSAVGSFGFELEEHQQQEVQHPLFEDGSPVELALQQAQDLLRSTAGTDDELTDAIAGLDPRVIKALRAFLDTLVSNGAVCALEHRGKVFRFEDVSQVRRGLERLDQNKIHEDDVTFEGVFQGVLPKRRTFEFRVTADGEVITGKIGVEIENADAINQHLNQPVKTTMTATQIGNGRPKYVLKELPSWNSDAEE